MARRSTTEPVHGEVLTTRTVRWMCAVTGLVFPGLGLLIIPSLIFSDFQVGGLIWVAVWGALPLAIREIGREHRVVGADIVTRSVRREWSRRLSDMTAVRPSKWFFPGVVVEFADQTRIRCTGVDQRAPFVAATLAGAGEAVNHLPLGRWMWKRQVVWFALMFVAGNNS